MINLLRIYYQPAGIYYRRAGVVELGLFQSEGKGRSTRYVMKVKRE